MTVPLDFPLARLKHLFWKTKLKSFLEGKEGLTEAEAVSARDCQLGKWLYAEGLEKYKSIPEMQALEEVHERLHATVGLVIELKISGQGELAEAELARMEEFSQKLLLLLDLVEQKVK